MAIEKVNIEAFLDLSEKYTVIDARSPGEFKHAHIQGAYNLPLFTDEERKVVGTAYKQQSREVAIKIGLEYFGVKMWKMVEEVEALNAQQQSKSVLVHCWRGGMRSAAIAWLLDLYGFKVYTLNGGYKKFRQYVAETFLKPFDFKILGGFTGSGKTDVLHELAKKGHKVIDLEGLAIHKGSAFGSLGLPAQPSQEMFENMLAIQLRKHSTDIDLPSQSSKCIWLEDESQRIGSVNIPTPIWKRMGESPVYFFVIPFDARLLHIEQEYGKQDQEKMKDAITRIRKRLGGLETKTALHYLRENNLIECFRILLKYYDKCYLKSLHTNDRNQFITRILCEKVDKGANSESLIQQAMRKLETSR